MKIETKHNVGDKFWVMRNNKPVEYVVYKIIISYNEENYDYMTHPTSQISYYNHNGTEACSEHTFYSTKAELLATL